MPIHITGQSVFEKTYHDYLNRLSGIISRISPDMLGVLIRDNEIDIQLLNHTYHVSQNGVTGPSGKRPSFDICVILLKYLLTGNGSYSGDFFYVF